MIKRLYLKFSNKNSIKTDLYITNNFFLMNNPLLIQYKLNFQDWITTKKYSKGLQKLFEMAEEI